MRQTDKIVNRSRFVGHAAYRRIRETVKPTLDPYKIRIDRRHAIEIRLHSIGVDDQLLNRTLGKQSWFRLLANLSQHRRQAVVTSSTAADTVELKESNHQDLGRVFLRDVPHTVRNLREKVHV